MIDLRRILAAVRIVGLIVTGWAALPLHAVSPSISPWETILSANTESWVPPVATMRARMATSVPPPLVTGSEGTAESGRVLTITMRLAKPVPTDLEISGEFTMDPGMSRWMFTGITGTDADQGDHIDRTFRAPLMNGFPPTGFMRVKVTTP